MKIAIKKKYIGALASFVTLYLGYWLIQELLVWMSYKNLSAMLLPLFFLVSMIYTINYWSNLRFKEKLADEVSREVSRGDPLEVDKVKNYLFNKHYEEKYTLNILKGKIKFTSSWPEQEKLEKIISNKHIPEIIKREFIKRA